MKFNHLGKTALLLLALGAGGARAQFAFRAVPSPSTVAPGGALSINVYLDAAPAGHNYATARAFLSYGQNGVSPFVSAAFTPANGNGGFSAVAPGLTNAAISVNAGGSAYQGASLLFANATARTDAGSYLLGTLSATVRPDLAPGTYTVQFVDAPGSAARTRVLGDTAYATTLGTATFTVGSAAVPGDVNGDGKFDAADAAVALRIAAGLQTADAGNVQRGDIMNDGALTPSDAAALLRKLKGL